MARRKLPSWKEFQRTHFTTEGITKRAQNVERATVIHARKFIFGRLNNIRSVQHHVVGWVLLIGVLIGLTALQMVVFRTNYTEAAPTNGGTYAEAALGPLETLNPVYARTSAERSVSQLVFSRLYTYDNTGQISGDIATKLEREDDEKRYIISLRDDVEWSDGEKLTAEDVVFTIDLLGNPAARAAESGWQGISARAINDSTVEISLPTAYAPFQHALTFAILPEHILGEADPARLREHDFSKEPVGSGPFAVRYVQSVNMAENRRVVHLIANERYHKGAPRLEKFQLHTYGTREAIVDALKLNEVNATGDIAASAVGELEKSTNFNATNYSVQNGVYALFNTDAPIAKDAAVRQALQLATNTAAIRDAQPSGGKELHLPFIAYFKDRYPAAPEYNTERAAQVLDEAGWVRRGSTVREKDGQPLALRLVVLEDSGNESAASELQSQWAELGVKLEINVISSTAGQDTLQTVLQPRNYDVLLYELSFGGDIDPYAYWHSSQAVATGLNFSNYKNAISDDALASARSRVDPESRTAKYVTFARKWLEDVPAIGLYQSEYSYVSTDSLSTLQNDTQLVSSVDRYNNIRYWSVRQDSVYKTP
ncbi:peptide ABC transporter substrate-binding protein [Candidatus Saccharibacteria bacterium]|nr:peptide ABC transporter substrate-binding protein [Candidatus Saccharibacteria bacterium]